MLELACKVLSDRIAYVFRSRLTPDIRRSRRGICDDGFDGGFDGIRCSCFTKMPQH